MVASGANNQDGRNIFKGDMVFAKPEDKGLYFAKGHVEEVCTGGHCFVVLCQRLCGLHRTSRRQHMRITWTGATEGPDLVVKFGAKARTCNGQVLHLLQERGLKRMDTPCKVWPLVEEQDTAAQAAVRRAREIVMGTDRETGKQTLRLRGADPMSDRGDQECVYGGAGGEDQ